MPIEHDPARRRFSLPADRGDAHLDYRAVDEETLEYHHTWVEPRLRGRGVAAQVVREALDHARAEGKRVLPTCSYVRAFLARHPEYADLDASR
jgi:predicted GNAT family acetyltransferase